MFLLAMVFTCVIPVSVAAIPPIPLAFFDLDKGRYVVAKTGLIRLDVAPTRILTDADLGCLTVVPINCS